MSESILLPTLRTPSNARHTVAAVGDIWTLRLLREMFRGYRRYSEFLRRLGVSRAVLTDRLQRLESSGLIERHVLGTAHPDYRLTACGLDLWSVYLAMWLWQLDWEPRLNPALQRLDAPRPTLEHTVCGHPTRPVYRCSRCGQEVSPFDTEAVVHACSHGSLHQEVKQTSEAGSLYRQPRDSAKPGTTVPVLMRVIGDRWSCAIVGAAFRGAKLFSEFEQALDIRPNQLTDRLSYLQQLGILRAQPYAGSRNLYKLTRAGIGLYPVTLELMQWGDRWFGNAAPPLLTVQHKPCGAPLFARWHCGHCDGVLHRQEIRLYPGA